MTDRRLDQLTGHMRWRPQESQAQATAALKALDNSAWRCTKCTLHLRYWEAEDIYRHVDPVYQVVTDTDHQPDPVRPESWIRNHQPLSDEQQERMEEERQRNFGTPCWRCGGDHCYAVCGGWGATVPEEAE